VLISYRGEALLSDFGLSDLLESSLPITVEVSGVGKINWRSPEHLDAPRGSGAGDVWAFGMTALVRRGLLPIRLPTLKESVGTIHSSAPVPFNLEFKGT